MPRLQLQFPVISIQPLFRLNSPDCPNLMPLLWVGYFRMDATLLCSTVDTIVIMCILCKDCSMECVASHFVNEVSAYPMLLVFGGLSEIIAKIQLELLYA